MSYSKWLVILGFLTIIQGPTSSSLPLSSLWTKSPDESKQNAAVDDESLSNGYSHVEEQLKIVACPARADQDLKDYWRCLWRTSLSAQGISQERMGIIERYYESAGKFPTSGLPREERLAKLLWKQNVYIDKHIRKKRSTNNSTEFELGDKQLFAKINKRSKRDLNLSDNDTFLGEQLANGIYDDMSYHNGITFDFPCLRSKFSWEHHSFIWTEVAKIYRNAVNNRISLVKIGLNSLDMELATENEVAVLTCQQKLFDAGVSFKTYLGCLQDSAAGQLSSCIKTEIDDYKVPDLAYDLTDAPKYDISGSERFYVNKLSPTDNKTFDFRFKFKKISEEDSPYSGFFGADPYKSEQVGTFKYRYDNLARDQKQPGWSYVGKDATADWHKLDLRRFYIPLRDDADLKKLSLEADIAQSYPGVGEIATHIDSLVSPLEYLWKTSTGYFLHNRYLLPLLDENDINYYKSKEAIPETFTLKPDSEVLNDIINSLQNFQREAENPIDDSTNKLENISYFEVYEDFLQHYYNVELKTILDDLEDAGKTEAVLLDDFDHIRKALYSYLEAVVAYEACAKDMVSLNEERRSAKNKRDMIEHAEKNCPNLDGYDYINQTYTKFQKYSTMPPKVPFEKMPEFMRKGILLDRYRLHRDKLAQIYENYFERKEARQRYSLPVYPREFPICRHSEPSPINILTSKAKKSSLREYHLGPSGSFLNKFFLMLPIDGTPLLHLGIQDGWRLDESSVALSGGAVKGHNLTFQYMFFRYSHSWKIEGSEHRLDGVGAPMEIQLLFTISGSADDLKFWHILARVQNQMFQFREKLIVMISFLVDVLETEEELIKTIAEKKTGQDPYLFEPIAQAAYLFKKDEEVSHTEAIEKDVPRGYVSDDLVFRLADFIPKTSSRFFTYRGSITWPPCFGYVIWSVFEQRFYITKRQFDMIAKVPAKGIANHNLVADNYRNPEYIFVEAEDQQDYATQQKLKNKRTVDRYVLEGLHNPTDHEQDLDAESIKIVDEHAYYQTEEEGSATSLDSSLTVLALLIVLNYVLTNKVFN